jgi:hypothetical protein
MKKRGIGLLVNWQETGIHSDGVWKQKKKWNADAADASSADEHG